MPKKRPAAERRPKKPRPKVKRRRTPVKNGEMRLTARKNGIESIGMITSDTIHPIKRTLILRGKSVAELSRDTGINRTRIHHFISGFRPLPDEQAKIIAKALRVSLAYIKGENRRIGEVLES